MKGHTRNTQEGRDLQMERWPSGGRVYQVIPGVLLYVFFVKWASVSLPSFWLCCVWFFTTNPRRDEEKCSQNRTYTCTKNADVSLHVTCRKMLAVTLYLLLPGAGVLLLTCIWKLQFESFCNATAVSWDSCQNSDIRILTTEMSIQTTALRWLQLAEGMFLQ